MPEVDYLFDSAGNWIAFKRGAFVFYPTGGWLGWVSQADHVYDADGNYFGTVLKDRLFRDQHRVLMVDPDHRGYPGREMEPMHPGYPGRAELPDSMEDIGLLEHA